MLLVEMMAGKTSDILDALGRIKNKRPVHIAPRKVWVRAYVVPGYARNKPIPKVVSLARVRKQRELKRKADKILASRA